MSEKTKIRVTAIVGGLVCLLATTIGQYLLAGGLSSPSFIGGLLGNVAVLIVVVGFVLIFPEAFTRSRLRERQLEWRRNRAGQVIVAVLVGMALLSLAALLLNGYRLI